MYHAITRARVRSLWRQVNAGNYRAAVGAAAPDLHFHFHGDTPVSARLTGRDAFERWFGELMERFPTLRSTVRDVVVRGWPWNTTVVVRLDITGGVTTMRSAVSSASATTRTSAPWPRAGVCPPMPRPP
ncbi:nuclear transport factor 2 family protein [Kitasatospora sp. NPDC006697]|uniref:nuclear transport factor 2 family protein n=1 Tax=Kitasatospora sp. NPDC006697 TaxID=3364020 RepID=UPI0036B0E0CC